MKIQRIKISQIKGIQEVEIHARPHLNEIGGKNGAGKSSVLDAICYALAGGRALPEMPVRAGADAGAVHLETDTLTIIRNFKNGKSTIKITGKDGGSFGQSRLNDLWGAFSFDPLEFSRMKPGDQIATLKSLAGPEFVGKLADLETRLEAVFTERTLTGRELKSLGTPAPVEPVEPVDLSGLLDALEAVRTFNADQQERGRIIAELERDRTIQTDALVKIQAEMAALQKRKADTENRIDALSDAIATAARPETPRDPEPLQNKLRDADTLNQRAQAYQTYLGQRARAAAVQSRYDEQSTEVDALRADRLALMLAAPLPVDGLTFGSGGLELSGLPFDQLSSAEKLRLSAAIGMATAPELRVMLIKDGSLLDADSFSMLGQMAIDADCQLWVETVGAGHDADCLILEDGLLAGGG